jgi:ribosomal protein S18 acetylase RimI-like enzyme
MIIRPLQPGDAAGYLALRRRALAEAPQFVGPLGEREAMGGMEELLDRLAAYPAEGTQVFGSFANEALAAAAGLNRSQNPRYSHKMFLWGMYVLPEYRRQACGRGLLEHLLDLARGRQGVRLVNLQVTAANEPAKAFYRRSGFASYGIEPVALQLDGQFYDFEMMQCVLARPASSILVDQVRDQ